MPDAYNPLPDWRDADAYRPLLDAEPAEWAWEFGRRAAGPTQSPAELCYVAQAPRGDPRPAVLWRWRCDPSVPVLSVSSAAGADPGALDLKRLDLPVIVVRSEDGDQHVWIADGPRRQRFAVVEGDALAGPVRCQVHLPSAGPGEAALEGARRLIGLRDTGRLPPIRLRPMARPERWMQSLRAHDARQAGASQREIALCLFGAARVREDWSGGSDYMRMRVQRLVRGAQSLVAGGYRAAFGMRVSAQPRPRVLEVWRSAAWARAKGDNRPSFPGDNFGFDGKAAHPLPTIGPGLQ
jgi:hypothetical protein